MGGAWGQFDDLDAVVGSADSSHGQAPSIGWITRLKGTGAAAAISSERKLVQSFAPGVRGVAHGFLRRAVSADPGCVAFALVFEEKLLGRPRIVAHA